MTEVVLFEVLHTKKLFTIVFALAHNAKRYAEVFLHSVIEAHT